MKKSQLALLIILILTIISMCVVLVFLLSKDISPKDTSDVLAQSDNPLEDDLADALLPEPIPEPIPEDKTIRLVAVGDNLFHAGVHLTGKQADGTYDFSFLFETIQPYLDDADIKIINQETIFGGNHRGNDGHLGYPLFNTRTEVGDAIAEAGFNVVTHSTNHTADQGLDGLLHCVSYWEENHPDVLISGIRGEATDEIEIPTMEIEGVTFAFLNYAYSPNMASFPSKYEGYMDMLCYYDPNNRMIDFTTIHPKVLSDIERAEEIADIVVVAPHWGTEYTTTQSGYQEEFARQMTEAGADIIIGTHPHVVQPVSYVESENGNKSLCYYSLGNYVSTQKQVACMLEGMAVVTLTVTPEGEISINEEETGVIPLVCQYTQGSVRIENIYFLHEYTEEMAQRHGMYTYAGIALHKDDLVNLSQKVFGEWEMKPYLDVISLEDEDASDDSNEEVDELPNAS